jgi:hypothetical protein
MVARQIVIASHINLRIIITGYIVERTVVVDHMELEER